MFTLGQEHYMEEASKPQPIMFTAGAIPVINKKGEVSMEKVHVKRYVAGKRPEWAAEEESDSEDEDKFGKQEQESEEEEDDEVEVPTTSSAAVEDDIDLSTADDRRLQRLRQHGEQVDVEERIRRRRIHEPEVIAAGSDEDEDDDEEEEDVHRRVMMPHPAPTQDEESSDDEAELDEEEIEQRRAMLRERAKAKRNHEEELLAFAAVQEREEQMLKTKEDEEELSTDDESEYTDSDDEDGDGPRLKPVFVRKKDRLTIQEREKEEERQRLLGEEKKKQAEERRKYTLKLVEKEARLEVEGGAATATEGEATNNLEVALLAIDSDDGNDEAEYEGWKLRELKRVKRDRDEREAMQREKEEIERMAKLTPEERRAELRVNPKHITNEKQKGKYKFLQKYYHRGAFFMDKDDGVYTRDFAEPTLEDHFDKTILPKVMQVKNFGRSGRTKYTHLVDQDTTNYDSTWAHDIPGSNKFMQSRAGGMKQVFERPSTKKRKHNS